MVSQIQDHRLNHKQINHLPIKMFLALTQLKRERNETLQLILEIETTLVSSLPLG